MNREKFFTRLAAAIYKIDGAYDCFARDGKVKPNLLWLLYALNDGRPHTQKRLCKEWLFPTSTVNTLVKECTEHGLVSLHKISGERREMEIRLTSEGKKFADKLLQPVYDAEEKVLADFCKTHGGEFLDELEQFADALDAEFNARCDNAR